LTTATPFEKRYKQYRPLPDRSKRLEHDPDNLSTGIFLI